jgi:hypothetical protein
MGIAIYSCGCSISSSMFEQHEIMNVNVCDEHQHKTDIQLALNNLAIVIRKTQELR